MEKVSIKGDGFVFGEKGSPAQGVWRRGVDTTEPPLTVVRDGET